MTSLHLPSLSLLPPAATRTPAWLLLLVLLALACYLGARIGIALPHLGTEISLIWPPTGIALAALVRWGPGVWPGIWAGAFAIALWSGLPLWVALALASGNTAGPTIAALFLRQLGLHPALDRRQDLLQWVAIGVGAGMLVAATNSVFWLAVAGLLPSENLLQSWLYRWMGDAVGVLVVGVPLLTLSRATLKRKLGDWRWLAAGLLVAVALVSGMLAFALSGPDPGTLSPLIFLPHLLLCWLALRSGICVASIGALLLSAGAALATARGHGPFLDGDTAHRLALLWGYVCTLAAIPLLVTALIGELAANEARWQLALDGSRIGVGEWDVRSGRITCSRGWLAMLGYAESEFAQDIAALLSCIHPDDRPLVLQAAQRRRDDSSRDAALECRVLRKDGRWMWFEVQAQVAERAFNGAPLRVVGTASDISERRASQVSRQLAASLFEHLHEGLLITDPQLRVLDANPAFTQITGHGRDEMIGTVPALLRPASPAPSVISEQRLAMLASVKASGAWRGEVVERGRDGKPCTLAVTISAVRDRAGEVMQYVIAISDITQARLQLEQLERQAHFDELTRLPNRVRLMHMLREALAASEREGFLLTVCSLDLDHFKRVNDRYGHEAGDHLLQELSRRLQHAVRPKDGPECEVARLGGDEFAFLLRTRTLEQSRLTVESLVRELLEPYRLGVAAGPVVVTASVGATVYPIDRADPETLLRHADHAMYGAKQAGRNGYEFFDAEHDRRTEQRFEAQARVQHAFEARQFCLYYQPKVDMRSGQVQGVEALLRWKHPQLGVLAPAHFLPLIEHTDLGTSVGDWVLQQGIEQLAYWLRMGLDFSVSINVSARHLQEPGFGARLAGLLSRHAPHVAQRLVIEVLETAALVDVDHTCRLMDECRDIGVRFALDDFGTGYSTLTYLKRLPLDLLKIDRSFVHNMLNDSQDLAIVEGVIGLSRTFACSVVAEGVENRAQAQRLIEIGCDVGQGNGIAPPMPAEEVARWVQGYRGHIDAATSGALAVAL